MTRPTHLFKPPMREGVSASCVALPSGPWTLLVDFLAQRLPAVAHADWRARMAQGKVLDAQGAPLGKAGGWRGHVTGTFFHAIARAKPAP